MDRALFYIFVLSLVLIALAYYVGLTSDLPVVANALQKVIFAVTGRTSKGKFASYPGGGSATTAA